jgi:hypothetical protein
MPCLKATNYVEANSSDDVSDTDATTIKPQSKQLRACQSLTFGHEKVDFEMMIQESFFKSQVK